jgi:hypothetical protein
MSYKSRRDKEVIETGADFFLFFSWDSTVPWSYVRFGNGVTLPANRCRWVFDFRESCVPQGASSDPFLCDFGCAPRRRADCVIRAVQLG